MNSSKAAHKHDKEKHIPAPRATRGVVNPFRVNPTSQSHAGVGGCKPHSRARVEPSALSSSLCRPDRQAAVASR